MEKKIHIKKDYLNLLKNIRKELVQLKNKYSNEEIGRNL